MLTLWRYLHMGTSGFLFFMRSLVAGFQLLRLSTPEANIEAGGIWKPASLERRTGVSLGFDNGFHSDILLVGSDGVVGSRQINCPGGQGKDSPAAFGFVASGQEEGGSGTPAAWPKKLLCYDMQLIPWRALLPWQEIRPPPKHITPK